MPLESVIENISNRYNLPGETVKQYVADKGRNVMNYMENQQKDVDKGFRFC